MRICRAVRLLGDLYQVLLPAILEHRKADGWVKPAPAPTPAPVVPRPPEKSMTAPGVQRAAPRAPAVAEEVEVTKAPSRPASSPRKMDRSPAACTTTITQRVIEYLREHGPVTSAELRPIVGLGARHYPSNYFQRALHDGRILRHGRFYSVPAAAPAAAAEPAPVVSGPPASAVTSTVLPPVAPIEIAPALVRAVAPFRFARWSDGSIEIHRDGKIAITLAPDECVLLAPSIAMTMMGVVK